MVEGYLSCTIRGFMYHNEWSSAERGMSFQNIFLWTEIWAHIPSVSKTLLYIIHCNSIKRASPSQPMAKKSTIFLTIMTEINEGIYELTFINVSA
jgi:hypothetical protein